MNSAYAFDVNADNFQQIVIDGSQHTPVLVDFWASWCGPCKVLKPVLEKLAEEYQGKFILAKLETDANQELASQFAIRGVPTVKAFVQGKVVDEFSGALPESQVRNFIDKLIPSPSELLRLQARDLREAGDTAAALNLLGEAHSQDPKNDAVRVDMAALLFEAGELDAAQALLDKLSLAASQQTETQALAARIAFARQAKDLPDRKTLEQQVEASPGNLAARLQLANLLITQQEFEPALEQLLAIIRVDAHYQNDIARKTMLSVFALMGGSGEIVTRYRKLLSSALN